MTVDTPDGEKSGSAVREEFIQDKKALNGQPCIVRNVEGEAIPIDLGDRGYLIAAMGNASDLELEDAIRTIPPEFKTRPMDYYRSLGNEKFDVKWDQPGFMSFVFIPKDSKKIIKGNLGQMPELIADVHLKNIGLQMTKEPLSHDLSKLFPWLPRFEPGNEDAIFFKYDESKNWCRATFPAMVPSGPDF